MLHMYSVYQYIILLLDVPHHLHESDFPMFPILAVYSKKESGLFMCNIEKQRDCLGHFHWFWSQLHKSKLKSSSVKRNTASLPVGGEL